MSKSVGQKGFDMKDRKLSEILQRCRKVTEQHIKNHGGKWDLEDQINHIHAEVTEFWLAYHGRHIKEGNNKYSQMMEEASDIILATITAIHILGNDVVPIDDYEIQRYLELTLEKIEDRTTQKTNNRESIV